nr:hypothetical protein [Tanacetum cinerariifolium]
MNDRVPSTSKSSLSKNKGVKVEEHHRNLLFSKNTKHMSSTCNNIKLDSQNVISKVVCAMCKQCLISVNHDVVQICLWCVDSGCSKHMTSNLKLFTNFIWKFLGTVRFGNDHITAEAIATACYTKNRSIIHHQFNKTPYMLINGRKPYISFLHVLEALSYPKNDREDLRKLSVKDSAPTPINSSSHVTYIPNTSKDVDELEPQPQHDSVESSSHYVDPSNMHTSYQTYPQEYQWTKDHPLEQVIASRLVLIRNQLRSDGDMCMMEAIRLFLAYTAHKSFIVFQMDMKTTFLHGTLKEGVYVCLPKGFIDADHLSHVYKLKKALYGLKQAPRAWYDELSKFLLQNHFFKGTIDPTLFIRHFDDDILLSIYVLEILKKYRMETCDPIGTPMEIKDTVDLDKNETLVNATKYHSMIGALMYLTSSRTDIVHATCLYARYQAKPTEKHLKEVIRIFCYL